MVSDDPWPVRGQPGGVRAASSPAPCDWIGVGWEPPGWPGATIWPVLLLVPNRSDHDAKKPNDRFTLRKITSITDTWAHSSRAKRASTWLSAGVASRRHIHKVPANAQTAKSPASPISNPLVRPTGSPPAGLLALSPA